MADTPRIILHIGTHKTGTSSFQQSLRANARRLKRRGTAPFSLPLARARRFGFRKTTYNCTNLAQAFLRPGCATIARIRAKALRPKPAKQAATRSRMLDLIARHREPALIVSAEAFCFLRTPDEKALLRAFLDATGREVQIVLTLRDEADWRASWNNQLRKKPEVWKRMTALPEEQRTDAAWYFDRAAIIDFWSDLGDLTIVDYDEALARDGNVIPALYRAMGVDPAGLKADFEKNTRAELAD
jgi:hypothetical protein